VVNISRVEQAELSAEEIDEVLGSRVSAVLSFVDKNGYPRLLPCWFMWDGEAFCTTSDPDKFHVKCLRRDPRSAMCVELADGVLPPAPGSQRRNWQVKGFGDMEIIDDPEGHIGRAIRTRYLTDGNESVAPEDTVFSDAAAAQRLVLRLKPTRLSAHGGRMYFGD